MLELASRVTSHEIEALRRRRLLAAGALVGLAVTACSPQQDPSVTPPSGTQVEHVLGTTEIPEKVERVVTLGFTDHDAVLALGIVPVAVNQWYPTMDRGVGEWAEPLLAGQNPEFVRDGADLAFERILALEPDVILALYYDMDTPDYRRLSEIAPTVAAPVGTPAWGIDWKAQTTMVGLAVNKAAEAEELIARVEGQIAAVANDHPELAGLTTNYIRHSEGSYYAYAGTDPRIRLLESLGLVLGPEVAAMPADDYLVEVSAEMVAQLDADVLILTAEPDDRLDTLPAVRRGSYIVLDSDVEEAFSTSSVLSIPFTLDSVVPPLLEAVSKIDR